MNLFFPNRIYHQKDLIPLAESLQDHPESWLRDLAKLILEWFDPSDTIRLTTSGSTGTPSQIRLLKSAMKKSALKTGDYFNLGKQSSALAALPYSFIAGKMMFIRAVTLNWNLHIVAPSSNPLAYIDEEIDFVAMTPHQLLTVLKQTPSQLHYVKKILLGGAPVSSELDRIIQSLKPEIYLGYGMTETITHIAVKRLNGTDPDSDFHALPGINFTIGKDDSLIITADHLEKSIQTTDIVDLKGPSSFSWLGRKDNVINSGGIKIHPETIEEKLQEFINVPFFIIGQKDEHLGETVALCIESTEILNNDLLERSFSSLGKYEIPKHTFYCEEFLYTATGKIRRKESFKQTLIE